MDAKGWAGFRNDDACMNIVGICGLEQAVPFKRKFWPNLDVRDYRISQGHDAAAALVCSGKIVAAAAEERFNRQKQTAQFPAQAIDWCLNEAGLQLGDINAIVHGFDYEPYRAIYSADPVSMEFYETVLSHDALCGLIQRDLPGFPLERVFHVAHHQAHAASAYYTSGWDECLVVVIDAMGEAHGTSVYAAHNGQLNRIAAFSAQDSIGILYSLITLHLGFEFNSDEYKIMGLAPYGDPARHRDFFAREVILRDDGSIRIPLLRLNRTRGERENYLASRDYLNRHLVPALPTSAEVTQEHCDIAAALQERLNEVLIHLCGTFRRSTGLRNLAMAGGVALNGTATGQLVKSGLFDAIHIQPASGDDGTALGAALAHAAENDKVVNTWMPAPLLGPAYDEAAVEAALAMYSAEVDVHTFPSLEATCAAAADFIAQGRVVAWFRGRMEFGPRALGNRSILADPADPEMRDRINAMVKKREAFRPFAPSVTLEEVDRWFEVAPGTELTYMITVVDVRAEWRAALSAITHVNGSARVQTVSSNDNADFHQLLVAVGKRTGRQMVLNTSFNVKGQPIVNTPADAIACFLGTGIDGLFLGNRLISVLKKPVDGMARTQTS